jgi:hypothetical protein
MWPKSHGICYAVERVSRDIVLTLLLILPVPEYREDIRVVIEVRESRKAW